MFPHMKYCFNVLVPDFGNPTTTAGLGHLGRRGRPLYSGRTLRVVVTNDLMLENMAGRYIEVTTQVDNPVTKMRFFTAVAILMVSEGKNGS